MRRGIEAGFCVRVMPAVRDSAPMQSEMVESVGWARRDEVRLHHKQFTQDRAPVVEGLPENRDCLAALTIAFDDPRSFDRVPTPAEGLEGSKVGHRIAIVGDVLRRDRDGSTDLEVPDSVEQRFAGRCPRHAFRSQDPIDPLGIHQMLFFQEPVDHLGGGYGEVDSVVAGPAEQVVMSGCESAQLSAHFLQQAGAVGDQHALIWTIRMRGWIEGDPGHRAISRHRPVRHSLLKIELPLQLTGRLCTLGDHSDSDVVDLVIAHAVGVNDAACIAESSG